MPSIVIVALPADDEPVWKFSSEKKPHMTLLYMNAPLGVDEEGIIRYVEHAVKTSLRRFGLSVDRRGTLGEDDADVLFFNDDFAYHVRAFRAMLLKNDSIAENYVKADQFPGWTPHLTMGYPKTPATDLKVEDRYMLSWVNFDKIAVWTSDYDGPEFELGSEDRMELSDEASWSDDYGVYIMHYGKKGMRWGVRRATDSSGLVKGSVADAIAGGQKPKAEKSSRQGGKGEDHKTMVKNLSKDVEKLSTNEIREVTARIKAVNEFKATTAAQKAAKASTGKKLAQWALKQVVTGAKRKGESWIQETVGDALDGVLPKTNAAKAKAEAKAKADAADKTKSEKTKSKDDASTEDNPVFTPPKSSDTPKPSPERSAAIRDLAESVADAAGVYDVTSMPKGKKKKGG